MSIEINERHSVVLPKLVPCPEGRCPERLQLNEDTELYRCMRAVGYHSPIVKERYTADCYFHSNPMSADDVAYWHRKQGQQDRRTAL